MKTTSVLLVGVGGQGIVSASDIIADMALNRGMDVKKSEIHGMSQRGGVVHSFVRFGEKVYSPVPFAGDVDYMLAFEQMEALRWAGFINAGTMAIVSLKKIRPVMMLDKDAYPDVRNGLKTGKIYFLDAAEEAKRIGNEKVESSVLLGAFCSMCGFSGQEFRVSLEKRIKKYIGENLKAFTRGKELAK